MWDAAEFDRVLPAFINYVRLEIKDFREAIQAFKEDLPTLLKALHDLNEMLIQHSLTEDIFPKSYLADACAW